MVDSKCPVCHGELEAGFVTTTNGSGLLWAVDRAESRLRPTGLEVLVPTGFGGTYSANLPGVRCKTCRTITLSLPK
ncbi:MAG: PF20097 family protein [Thermoplasmata archaeon]|nr:PF20097 family protein [Thermoplasmata archaeon]